MKGGGSDGALAPARGHVSPRGTDGGDSAEANLVQKRQTRGEKGVKTSPEDGAQNWLPRGTRVRRNFKLRKGNESNREPTAAAPPASPERGSGATRAENHQKRVLVGVGVSGREFSLLAAPWAWAGPDECSLPGSLAACR